MAFAKLLKETKPQDAPVVESLAHFTTLGSGPVADSRQWVKFDPIRHLTVGSGDPEQAYTSRAGERKNSVKWGQLKLLISEIDFLVRYWNPAEVPSPIFVYVGAATGYHIACLAIMFPWVTFHLYDQREFASILAGLHNVQTFQTLFLEEHITAYSGRSDVFFISDIRTLEYNQSETQSEASLRANEDIVTRDMALQMSWVQKIKPVRAHLKFRLHYGHKFMADIYPHQSYLDGTVYRQPWAPQTSTECRLVPFSDLRMRDWDYLKHENQMFYHNVVVRETVTVFENFIEGNREPFSLDLGLTNDYDSTATMFILSGYLAKIGIDQSKANLLALAKFVLERANPGTSLVSLRAGIREAAASAEDVSKDDD